MAKYTHDQTNIIKWPIFLACLRTAAPQNDTKVFKDLSIKIMIMYPSSLMPGSKAFTGENNCYDISKSMDGSGTRTSTQLRFKEP